MSLKNPANWVIVSFMTVVTCGVLAMAFAEMTKGLAHAPGTFVYALTAAFGLEFLISVWTSGGGREV